jgi:hypothetical protein
MTVELYRGESEPVATNPVLRGVDLAMDRLVREDCFTERTLRVIDELRAEVLGVATPDEVRAHYPTPEVRSDAGRRSVVSTPGYESNGLAKALRRLLDKHSLHGDVPADDIDDLLDRFDSASAVSAPPTITDEMVERAARALFEEPGHDPESPDYTTWADVVAETPERAAIWRDDARRVMVAALGGRGESPWLTT